MADTIGGTKRSEPEKRSKRKKAEEEAKASEVSPFQICVMGVPKFTTEQDLYKHLVLPIFPDPEGFVVGISKQAIKEAGFILFSSEAARKEFMTKFPQVAPKLKYHRARLTTYVPKPLPTSSFKSLAAITTKSERRTVTEVSEARLESIENQVLPWRDIPYPEQIMKKTDALKETMEGFFKQIKSLQGGVMVDCPFTKMIETSAENLEGYRNKVELTIGFDAKGDIEIGFVKGKMGTHYIEIDPIIDYPHVSAEAKEISITLLGIIKEFNKTHGLKPYNRIMLTSKEEEDRGFWRTLQVRQSSRTKEAMITVIYTKNSVPSELEGKIKDSLKAAFPLSKQIGNTKLVSLNIIQSATTRGVDYDFNDTLETLHGTGFYTEELLGYKFHVSPLSFLQVNTEVCEKMYEYVKELAEGAVKKETEGIILFDLYCGIGTIGICMEKSVSKVIGIEVVPSAIENARLNAELNGLKEKTEYHCGKVEELINQIATQYENKPIVAVVDPPRSGLHKDVLKKIRTCKGLDVLVYVSCNQQSLVRDALWLCQPNKGRIKGPGFTAVSYAGADLFPYTPHTECIMLFKRYYAGTMCS